MPFDTLVQGVIGHQVRVSRGAPDGPGVEGEIHHVVFVGFLPEPAARRQEHGTRVLVIGLRRVRRHVVLEGGFVIEPLAEGLVAGARGIQRARADEHDRRLWVSEADLGPAQWQGESFAWAVGAAVSLRDRAAVQPLERVRAEKLQVLLALAHAVKTTPGGG